jgi:hypothetical protein
VRRDGTVERVVESQFEVSVEARFEWLESERGPILSRCTVVDPSLPETELVYNVRYDRAPGTREVPLPERITFEVTGILPRPAHFDFIYAERP